MGTTKNEAPGGITPITGNLEATAEVKATATATVAATSAPEPKGPEITYEQFKAIEILVGEVKVVEPVPKSDKLLKLGVDFGERGTRVVVAGLAKSFPDPNALVSRRFAFVTNLAPRPMFGIESQAMILAATSSKNPDAVVAVDCGDAKVGSRLG
jgi:methionyl-tRNA synthetase